jgi:hypothetical protein
MKFIITINDKEWEEGRKYLEKEQYIDKDQSDESIIKTLIEFHEITVEEVRVDDSPRSDG